MNATATKPRWAWLGYAESVKLREARKLADARRRAADYARDYADPIYHEAELERHRRRPRKGGATLDQPPKF